MRAFDRYLKARSGLFSLRPSGTCIGESVLSPSHHCKSFGSFEYWKWSNFLVSSVLTWSSLVTLAARSPNGSAFFLNGRPRLFLFVVGPPLLRLRQWLPAGQSANRSWD